jgi:RecB family endonuclease NucS
LLEKEKKYRTYSGTILRIRTRRNQYYLQIGLGKDVREFNIKMRDNIEIENHIFGKVYKIGENYDLIYEDGEMISQQYRTDIGLIDILARDKKTGSHVVIELKKNQTSDDTVGQEARYTGWIMEKMKAPDVKGIIIAAGYDKRLEYALKMMPFINVFLYVVDFKLTPFNRKQ